MAEGIDPKNEEALKALADYVNKFGTQSKALSDFMADANNKFKEYKKVLRDQTKNEQEQQELTKQLNIRRNNTEKKFIEDQKKYAEEQRRRVKAREISEKEANDNIQNFTKTIASQIKDPVLSDRITQLGEKLEKTAVRSALFDNLIGEGGEKVKKSFLTAASTVGSFGLNLAKSYRNTGDQVGLATGILTEGANAAGSMLQSTGSAVASAGGALSAMPGKAKYAGMALQGLGSIASVAGTGLSKLATTVLPVLSQELNKNLAAFQSMSSSGALFSNGLTGMIETAGKAGMTLDTFNNVVKNNSGTLAGLGEGVSAGAKRAANALNAGGAEMRKSLLNLGFSIEEQGTLVAETMRDMRQAGGPLTATDSQIAQQTQKYAENLRIIAGITGEDAKKKMDEARQASQDLAFQQKLQGMGQVEQQNLVNAMANMNEIERKAFQEMVTFGQVITPSLAATVSQSGALQEKLNATMGQFQQGTLDATSFQDLGKQYNEQIKADMLSLTGLAQAGAAGVGGIVGDMYKGLNSVFQDVIKQTPEAIANAQKAAQDQKNTNDEMTKSMNEVVKAQNDAAIAIQDAILKSGVMTLFADQTKKATEALTNLIQKFTGETGSGSSGESAASKTGELVGEAAGTAIGAVVGSALGPAGTFIGGYLGGMAGSYLGKMVGGAVGGGNAAGQIPQGEGIGGSTISMFAKGGIIDGPNSGTLAMLHGKEMVLPLPDNLTPAKIGELLTGLTDMQKQMAVEQISNQTLTLNDLASMNASAANNTRTTGADESVPVLTRLSDQMEELLTATRLVVANTERTARGVA